MVTQENEELIFVLYLSNAVAQDTESKKKEVDHIVIDVEGKGKDNYVLEDSSRLQMMKLFWEKCRVPNFHL